MARYKEYGYDIKDGVGIIPEWETETKELAFLGCDELKSIDFPQCVTKIGEGAFHDCSSLTSVSIPPSVTEIGDSAFSRCSNLTSINIPSSVTEIGKGAFYGCFNLTSISIPPSVTVIGDRAFDCCSSITSIVVSKDNKVYDSREDCNAIIHTESNTLFRVCENTIIPPSVTKIGGWAFDGCSSLTSIIVSKDNKVYDSREGCNAIIHLESNTLLRGCENTLIPPSVTEIGDSAFYGCSSLTSISIPQSVTKIGYYAFDGCSNLTSISIPKGCKVEENAFYDCPKNLVITRY